MNPLNVISVISSRTAAIHLLLVFLFSYPSSFSQPLLRSIAEANTLSNVDLNSSTSVDFEAEIILLNADRLSGFIFDGEDGIHFALKSPLPAAFTLGDRVRVEGRLHPGHFRPRCLVQSMTRLRKGERSQPNCLKTEDILSASLDCRWVTFTGIVTNVINHEDHPYLFVVVLWQNQRLDIRIEKTAHAINRFSKVIHQKVTVSAVAASINNADGQLAGRYFLLAQESDMSVHPLFPVQHVAIPSLLSWLYDDASPVEIRGTVTRVAGRQLYLREEKNAIMVNTPRPVSVIPGQFVTARGYAQIDTISPQFAAYEVEIRPTAHPPEIPRPISLNPQDPRFPTALNDNLVTIHCKIETLVSESDGERLYCVAGQRRFEAKLEPDVQLNRAIAPGAEVTLTGICHLLGKEPLITRYYFTDTFFLQIISSTDIVVIKPAPWWNKSRLFKAVLATILITLVTAIWIIALRRKVSQQTTMIEQQVKRETLMHERQHLARELHDTLLQNLTGISLKVDLAKSEVLAPSPLNSAETLEDVQAMIASCQSDTRNAIGDLRAGSSTKGSLSVYIEDQLQESCRKKNIKLSVSTFGTPYELDSFIVRQTLKIIREATNNALMHSAASSLTVSFSYSAENLIVHIVDNGSGFSPAHSDQEGHFGLIGMRERADLIDGHLDVRSKTGQGTEVRLTVPQNADTLPTDD